ncbi:MAG: Holliday junction branch migration protein RuvA [Gammaproteobacteria bacterium]|nr:Holliday junction branch migration protein RuvA [Gammaproteobacteria bacterium]MCP5137933.1 Holliday junction branch migration protein RuvA [Gammaproteobacteria bacterium]
MIGFLRGQLVAKQPPTVLIDVNGVGYEVDVPMSTFFQLPALGDDVRVFTHLAVREDAHTLYGFASEAERRLFRTLLKVSGIGAKLALGILSGASADEFVGAVQRGDVAALTRLPGIGKKTAERLVVELRDRLGDFAAPAAAGMASSRSLAPPADATGDAISALQALGYKPADASRMVKAVVEDGLGSEELIRRALKGTVK